MDEMERDQAIINGVIGVTLSIMYIICALPYL